jgi:SAM-dependent methyltransferase
MSLRVVHGIGKRNSRRSNMHTRAVAAMRQSSEPLMSDMDEEIYAHWDSEDHVMTFNLPTHMDRWTWIWHWNQFNYTKLARLILPSVASITEVGCATGEYIRFLRKIGYRGDYIGYDVSRPAIDRAQKKLPREKFLVVEPQFPDYEVADLVIAIDVALHQPNPFQFHERLFSRAKKFLLLKERTTDTCPTSKDWKESCAWGSSTWVPWMVLNIQDVLRFWKKLAARQIVVARSYHPLAGLGLRYLPKYLYPETAKTAATSILVSKELKVLNGDFAVFLDQPEHSAPKPTFLRAIGFARRIMDSYHLSI